MSKPFYITTAIDYPNGAPHLGHVYEKLISDAYARWYRFLGREVYFLTGTDENGQKLVKAAEQAGAADTSSYIDANVATFRQLCTDLQLTNNDFIRTTEARHAEAVQALWRRLEEQGDIYFDRYAGLYCYGCESFYAESQLDGKNCPEHGTPLEFVEEDGYFFRMSAYQEWILKELKDHPESLFPESARREVISRLASDELRDLSISRPNAGWGIPVPDRPDHVIYTWFDALINYYSALDTPERAVNWPADMHVIGKDITWFHAVIWPTMLKAAGIERPKQVYVHGMVLAADGKKMSKSLGNVVSPDQLLPDYNLDLVRYYMLRAIASGQDGSFSLEDLRARNNNELANDFGNLVMRVVKLSRKRIGDDVPPVPGDSVFDFQAVARGMQDCMDRREHHRALEQLWEGIHQVNAYLNVHEPWRIKDDPESFQRHMYHALYGVHCTATLMSAFLPITADKTLAALGTENAGLPGLAFGAHAFKLSEPESLFPKFE